MLLEGRSLNICIAVAVPRRTFVQPAGRTQWESMHTFSTAASAVRMWCTTSTLQDCMSLPMKCSEFECSDMNPHRPASRQESGGVNVGQDHDIHSKGHLQPRWLSCHRTLGLSWHVILAMSEMPAACTGLGSGQSCTVHAGV